MSSARDIRQRLTFGDPEKALKFILIYFFILSDTFRITFKDNFRITFG